jgi:CheY-like chemotaxis protein
MVVDDNAEMRRLLCSIVGRSNSLLECDDGQQAVDAYPQFSPDWVFMDVEMPGKDGLTATEEICRSYPEARVVMVTRHADQETREAAAAAGACAYVDKENLFELRQIIAGKAR